MVGSWLGAKSYPVLGPSQNPRLVALEILELERDTEGP